MDPSESNLPDTDEFLAPRDVVQMLRISRSAFWKWVKSGYLPGPSIRVGKMPRWSKREVLARIQIQP